MVKLECAIVHNFRANRVKRADDKMVDDRRVVGRVSLQKCKRQFIASFSRLYSVSDGDAMIAAADVLTSSATIELITTFEPGQSPPVRNLVKFTNSGNEF